jgi:MFS family permease
MYQSECSPKWIRGAVVACYQWAITIGLLLASCANEGEKDKPDASGYRWVISIQFFWAAILAGGMCFLPESPRYLIKKGKTEKARANLGRVLRAPIDSPEVKAEYEEIEANLRHERSLGQTSYIDCFRNGPGHNRLRVLTGIFLQAWQQLTGINVRSPPEFSNFQFIFYYGTTFFTQAGISNPFVVSIVTNVVNVVSTLPGMWAVDNLGRRKLLLIGAAGMCICEYIVAIVGVSTSSTNVSAQQSLIAFVCIYIFFFAASWGPCAWVITGELYPLVCIFLTCSNSRESARKQCRCPLRPTGCGTGESDMPRPISSKQVLVMLVSESKYSSSGDPHVSAVSSLPTSSSPKPKVSLSNKSTNCTMTTSNPGNPQTGFQNLITGLRSAGRAVSRNSRGLAVVSELIPWILPLRRTV